MKLIIARIMARVRAHALAHASAHGNAVSAGAIPLREPTPGRRTEDPNAHRASL
ncbi:MAG: hypothetical protein WAK62_21465 [Terriglobales bacterium]